MQNIAFDISKMSRRAFFFCGWRCPLFGGSAESMNVAPVMISVKKETNPSGPSISWINRVRINYPLSSEMEMLPGLGCDRAHAHTHH